MKYPWIDEFLLSMPGATKDFKEEWQWTRYLIGDKMFAALCQDKTGQEVITIKLEPLEGDFLRKQYEEVAPGHYMNKAHWNSINLEGSLEDDLLKDLLTKSYNLVLGKLSKKKQRELLT